VLGDTCYVAMVVMKSMLEVGVGIESALEVLIRVAVLDDAFANEALAAEELEIFAAGSGSFMATTR